MNREECDIIVAGLKYLKTFATAFFQNWRQELGSFPQRFQQLDNIKSKTDMVGYLGDLFWWLQRVLQIRSLVFFLRWYVNLSVTLYVRSFIQQPWDYPWGRGLHSIPYISTVMSNKTVFYFLLHIACWDDFITQCTYLAENLSNSSLSTSRPSTMSTEQ